MPRKRTQLEELAQKLLQSAGYDILPGEYEFVSTAAREIHKYLEKWFKESGSGLTPPTPKTISNWFYQDCCPAWAMNLLFYAVKT